MLLQAQVQLPGFGGDGGEAGLQAAHRFAAHHGHDEGGHPHQHDNALDKIRLQGGGITAQHHHGHGRQGDDHHADPLVHLEQHRTDAGQPLIDRGGVGQQEDEDDEGGEQLHRGTDEPLVEKLRHGFDFHPAGGRPGTPRQHQPSQQGTEHRVADAGQNAPQAISPASAARVADEHHRREIRGAIGQGGGPGAGVPAADGELPHTVGMPAADQANDQHERKIDPDGHPNNRFLRHDDAILSFQGCCLPRTDTG